METKFEIIAKMNKSKLVKINCVELKTMRRILLILFVIGSSLAIVNLILQMLFGAILSQDIKDLIIAASGLVVAFFFPEIESFIQFPFFKLRHLDGKHKISITENAIKIQADKYAEKEYDFSLITKILDRDAYYKIMIKNRALFIFKKDFVKGDPEYFFEYLKSKVKQ